MADIKTRDVVKGTIKKIDKAAIAADRMRSAYVQTKEKAEHTTHPDEHNAEEYASDRVEGGVDRITHEAVHQFDKQGRKGLEETKRNVSKAKDGVQRFREKRAAESMKRQTVRTSGNKTIKVVEQTEKTIKQSTRSAGKKTIKTAGKGAAKAAQRSVKTTKTAIKTTQQAAKAAQIDDFIMSLPKGYATRIGDEGVKLSGGQQQRISIARAILKDAPIVVFDEATSYSDIENEHKIQLALQNLLRGKTTIMIAHRLHTIRNADKIVVFQDGKVVEQGTHDELIASGSTYSHMWDTYTRETIGEE